jgi:hypothetical protein
MIIAGFILIVTGTGIMLYRNISAPVGTETEDTQPIDISLEPLQEANPDTLIPKLEMGRSSFNIYPKARYRIKGMLVSKKRYLKGFMSRLSPWDYALIWGTAPNYLPYLEFEQMVRYCLFRLKSTAVVDVQTISRQMGNNHLIPATKNIRKALGKAKKHDLVSIEGYLVNVRGQDSRKRSSAWNTSLVRTDSGGGACEIIYVTKLRIGNMVYE